MCVKNSSHIRRDRLLPKFCYDLMISPVTTTNAALWAKLTGSRCMKDALCLSSLEALKVAFILLAEPRPPVNKARPILKEQPLYQATSQHSRWMV